MHADEGLAVNFKTLPGCSVKVEVCITLSLGRHLAGRSTQRYIWVSLMMRFAGCQDDG